jgi:hypothetical protein
MSTTPSVPAHIPSPLSWLQKHERIVIVALACALGAWGFQKYCDHAVDVADTRAAVAESKAAVADSTAAKNAVVVAQVTQQYQAMVQTLTAQNQTLASALSARQAQVAIQKKADTTLAPAALADRIATLSSVPPESVNLEGENISLTRPGAIAVAQALEEVPVLRANLQDETQIAVNEKTELDNADKLIGQQALQITDLNNARTADAAQYKAELAAAKAVGRKNSIKWFKRGFIVGLVSGLWAGHAAGL